MPLQQIPTSTDSTLQAYEQTTTLDGVPYVFRFNWNSRLARWTMSLMDSSREPILSGLVIVSNINLFDGHSDPRMPPGRLAAVDLGDSPLDAGLTDLGARVLLVYADTETIARLG